MKIIGGLLIVLGLVGLLAGGISWTKKEKVIDIGPVEVTNTEHNWMPIPPIAGGLCLAAGVLLVVQSRRRPGSI